MSTKLAATVSRPCHSAVFTAGVKGVTPEIVMSLFCRYPATYHVSFHTHHVGQNGLLHCTLLVSSIGRGSLYILTAIN